MSVFTPLSLQNLQAFLLRYCVGELLHYEEIEAGVENSNFYLRTTTGEYVLTLIEQHPLDQLDYFLQVVQFLAAAQLPVAKPLLDRHGRSLNVLQQKPAVLVPYLAGQTVSKPATVEQAAAIGAILARIHLAGQTFPYDRPPDRGQTWRLTIGQQLLPNLPSEEAKLLADELEYQQHQAQALNTLPTGLIHADLFCDNALFVANELSGVIDWYYACTDAWLYDLAIVVNDWCCNEDGSLNTERLIACLQAYHQHRPLLPAERDAWQYMLRAAALRFWLSRLVSWYEPKAQGGLILVKDPAEFRQKLQARRHETLLIQRCWPTAC